MVSWLLTACLLAAVCAAAGAANTVFPPGAPPADIVDVVDARKATPSMRLAGAMLQGLANRGPRASVYMLHPGDSDQFWLEHLKAKGYLGRTRNLTLPAFFERYGERYRKVFVYDPELTGSMNAAIMLGALEDGLAASPDDAAALAGERPVEDLRGRWSSNAAAITWAYSHLWPRSSRAMLATMNPRADERSLYDYITQHRVFTFWITGQERSDGKAARQLDERIVVERILEAAPANIPVIGFWFSGQDHGINEYTGVGMAGETGQYTVVSSTCGNLSLLSGIRVDWPAAVRRYTATLAERKPPELRRDRVYVCFEFTESGDAPLYLQNIQWREWQDPARGKLPFNWNVGPAILEMAPPIIEYFYDQATPNDYFYVALSGAGYNHPYRHLFSKVRDPEAAWRGYMAQTRGFMRRMGLTELQLYTDAWLPFDRGRNDAITERFANGIPELRSIVLGMGRDEGVDPDHANYYVGRRPVLVSHCMTRWDVDYAGKTREQNIAWLVDDIKAHAPRERPGFMHAMVLSWAYDPTEYVEVVRRLGEEFVPVTLAEFARLYARAHARPEKG
ncbi:MAG: hypothetical protein IT208_01575 [Chthonomonadales bacterium]|nr:hypothetical protein [Chthonomonadales bacterium]